MSDDASMFVEDAMEIRELIEEANALGHQVDIFLGVYDGESSIKTKAEARIAMARLDEIGKKVQAIIDRTRTS